MDILKQFLGEQSTGLVDTLVKKAGFAKEEATKFVPQAAEKTMAALKGGFDVKSLFGKFDVNSLLSKIDVAGLASGLKLDKTKVLSGLQTVVPMLVSTLKTKSKDAQGLMGMLGGGDAAGVLGAAKGIAGKLFGKKP